MKARAFPTLALVAIALAGCLVPPFDPDLSLAFRTADRMKLVAELGPVRAWGAQSGDLTFLPSQTDFTAVPASPAVTHGLLVAAGDYGPRAWYVDANPGGDYELYGDRKFVIDSTDAMRYSWQIFMIPAAAGSSDYFVLHDWMAAQAGNNDLTRVRYDRFVSNLDSTGGAVKWTDMGMTTLGSLVGACYNAVTNQGALLEGAASNFREHFFFVDGTGFSHISLRGDLPLPMAAGNGFYQHDPVSGRSVVSLGSFFGYTTWTWDSGLTPTTIPVGKRIDVLLSTGELYHRGDGTDIVYSWQGKQRYEFPVGNLRFVGERLVGGTPTLFYTLVLRQPEKDDDDKLLLRVYTIPTADLDELE